MYSVRAQERSEAKTKNPKPPNSLAGGDRAVNHPYMTYASDLLSFAFPPPSLFPLVLPLMPRLPSPSGQITTHTKRFEQIPPNHH